MSHHYGIRIRVALLGLSLLLLAAPALRAQSWQWVASAGGSGDDVASAIAIDSAGDTYVVGTFAGNITIGDHTFTNAPNVGLFLAKYSPLGTLLWATYAGGAGNFRSVKVAISRFGDLFVAGSFTGRVTFGSDQLNSAGGSDLFVARYDSSGLRRWSRRDGALGDETARALAVTAATEVVIAGEFRDYTQIGVTGLPSAGGSDVFVAKYGGDGLPLWASRAGGRGEEGSHGVGLSTGGDIVIAGTFTDTTVIGADTMASAGGSDAFVAKFSSAGGAVWGRRFGGIGNDTALALASDRFGNSYVAGAFDATMIVGGDTLRSLGGSDAFTMKLDGAGGVRWGRNGGGGDRDAALAVAFDPLGAVYITGRYFDSAAFGGVKLHDTSGNGDIFVVKYDAGGVPLWGRSAGGLGFDEGRAIGIDPVGDVRVAGAFSEAASFGSNQVGSAGDLDAFVGRIGPDPSITTGEIVVGPFCPGDGFNVPFTLSGTYGAGNTFTAQLSDSVGGFERSMAIGSLEARQGSLLSAAIPLDAPPGTGYRVRVVSSEPAVTGAGTTRPITINPMPAPVIALDGAPTICAGGSVTLDAGPGYRSYRWSNGLTTRAITVTRAGIYSVVVANTSNCEGISSAVMVRVITPRKPTIIWAGDSLEASEGVAYSWSVDGNVIEGATGRGYLPTYEGDYRVTVTDTSGCDAASDPFHVAIAGVDRVREADDLLLYPHPNRGIFTIELPLSRSGEVVIDVTDVAGRSVVSRSERGDAGIYSATIDIGAFPAGVYFVRVESAGDTRIRKVVKQ